MQRNLLSWKEVKLAMLLAAIVAAATWWGIQQLPEVLVGHHLDIWFDADAHYAFENMSSRFPDFRMTRRHPLFPMLVYPPVKALRVLFGLGPIAAVQVVLMCVAGLWTAVLFCLLRLMDCRRLDAVLFTLVGVVSASAMFWFVIPESWPFGSLSILFAMAAVAAAQRYRFSEHWHTAVSALTMSFTLTNWMAGIAAAFSVLPWRRALQVTVNAFALVIILWGLQEVLFSGSVFFIGERVPDRFFFSEFTGGPLQILTAFIFHPMVMPAITEFAATDSTWMRLSVQGAWPGSASPWGAVAVLAWAALLGLGLWAAFRTKQNRPVFSVLRLTLAGQLVLHLIFGMETFLFSLHWMPLLVILAAFSTFTRARTAALVLAGVLVITAGINNHRQFDRAAEMYRRQAAAHEMQTLDSTIPSSVAEPSNHEVGS